jgi:hypothetical protein
MKSFFKSILERLQLKEHDGRTLWQYGLSESDYEDLKNHLSSVSGYDLDEKDITLFYAEWWKNEYDGGSPKKQSVYHSLGRCRIREDDFYNYAKYGVIELGIPWIQRNNILYFRTLLMQGGLPLRHVRNNSGHYTNFLKKVLEIRPSSIEEFTNDEELIRYLPYSSRNDAIFQSCLNIVQAIWNGDEDYLKIFEANSSDQTSLKKISEELKEHKKNIEKRNKRRTILKGYWILNKSDNESKIRLEFNFPETIEKENFESLIEKPEQDKLVPEYNLIVDDILVCKFRQNIKGNYKIAWYNNSNIIWKGESAKPEIYISTPDAKTYNVNILMIEYPKLSEPSLWTKVEENKWKLQQGKYCKDESAIAIFPEYWIPEMDCDVKYININDLKFKYIEFNNYIKFNYKAESIKFKTDTTTFDWYIIESKPNWIVKSNVPVVTRLPSIILYDKSGEKIEATKLNWRLYRNDEWQKWNNTNLPNGLIELKIEANGCEETDLFYNIGDFDLSFDGSNNNQNIAQIIVDPQRTNLQFSIIENLAYSVLQEGHVFRLTLNDLSQGVKTVPCSINTINQVRKLYFEISSPFKGAQVLSPEGKVLENESIIVLSNLLGYRIISQGYGDKYFIKLYNTKRPQIKIFKKLPYKMLPLREYENLASRLLKLSDAMEKEASVSFELLDSNGEILNKYFFKNYNCSLNYEFENDQVKISTDIVDADMELYAVPLDCAPDNINLFIFEKNEQGKYILPQNIVVTNYIIFSAFNRRRKHTALPCFVTTQSKSVSSGNADKYERIEGFEERLHSDMANGSYWQRVLKYYKVCINHEIPFATFDIIRAASRSPELLARFYCVLALNKSSDNFIETICKNIEDDLGICFHWISQNDWEEAIEWIKQSYSNENIVLIDKLLREAIYNVLSDTEPIQFFKGIADFMQSQIIPDFDFHVNAEIINLRQSLGERVLNELPQDCPQIFEIFKPILPVNYNTRLIKILLKTPLAIALSITGKDESIWGKGENYDIIRRNMQYCQWIAPEWYGKAVSYCLSRLKNFNNF